MILKESKSLGGKKEIRKLDISRKRYIFTINTNILVKQTYGISPDLYSL